ncbi:DUF402 domain-containing protein [Leptolinea tardivitalis]|uniref:DUF402 domain-containing protein n=1 Tax=Leptolinea tardivitalis TaxID=229920 RepID=UPI000781910A|nr:DUF402 domain-containing protein [Leptolinea tardivitalis]GAP21766.1 uncharacterized protein associated with RNAses G and E [Leptolinea tardivitalis]
MSELEPETVLVLKFNTDHQETWRYDGKVISRTPESVLLEAYFNRPDKLFHGILLREGDRFVEKYFNDRWYNIFEIHDCDTDVLKGWYCNVTYPAVFEDGVVSYVDLALDLLVYPDGRQLVLDEDEFAELKLNEVDTSRAWQALAELQRIMKIPFILN